MKTETISIDPLTINNKHLDNIDLPVIADQRCLARLIRRNQRDRTSFAIEN